MDKDRAKGMLWGLIVGDALGSPIQFTGKDSHPHITEMVPCPVFGVPAGYWTDDGRDEVVAVAGGYTPSADGIRDGRWLYAKASEGAFCPLRTIYSRPGRHGRVPSGSQCFRSRRADDLPFRRPGRATGRP